MRADLFRVCSFNVEWFFHKCPPCLSIPFEVMDIEQKVKRLAESISKFDHPCHVIGLQEVEDEVVLQRLCKELASDSLSYEFLLGKYCSNRTLQRVAFLYDPKEVKIEEWNSVDPENTGILEKNIFMNFSFKGHKVSL